MRRHAIVVSRGAVTLLDPQELRAALAHELAHLARHDPGASWAVMAARALMWFNPAFQVLSRALARDAEWLADERAAEACGDRLALASGLIKLHRATAGGVPVRRTLPFAAALAEPLARVRSLDVEVRCRRLLDGAPASLPYLRARVCHRRRVPHDAAVLRGMTAHVTTSAARGGGAGLEVVRMLATVVWVSGATVVAVVLLGALPGWITGDRGTVREATSIQDAERRLGARILVPGYFPERAGVAAEAHPGRRRAARIGAARLSRRAPAPTSTSCRRRGRGSRSRPSCSGQRTVLAHEPHHRRPAPGNALRRARGRHAPPRARVGAEGWAIMLRSSGDVEELFRMARTSHRQGGR